MVVVVTAATVVTVGDDDGGFDVGSSGDYDDGVTVPVAVYVAAVETVLVTVNSAVIILRPLF